MLKSIFANEMKVSTKDAAVFIVRAYQRVLSPDTGFLGKMVVFRGVCTMYPTCSEYMILSIKKHGTAKGVLKGIFRIGRCHPFQKKLVDFP